MIDLSKYAQTLNHRPVAVYGLGASGIATVRALCAAGVCVYAGDDDPEKMISVQSWGAQLLDPEKTRDLLKNCAALILSPGIPLHFPQPHPIVTIAREQNIDIIGDIEVMARNGLKLKTVGITGTNGKSTTTALIAHLLNSNHRSALVCGNIGTPVLDLQIDHPDTILVIELSSYQLDLCVDFQPDIAVHLNLTPDHLDRHGSFEAYRLAKSRIFQGPGLGFCSVDDQGSYDLYEHHKNLKIRTMIPVSCLNAMNAGLYLSGHDIADDVNEGGIIGSLGGLPTLRGRHNQQNAMMAYGVARALGLTADQIFSGLSTYPGLPHRQLRVRTLHGVDYINDSKATNADATEKALNTYTNIHWIVGGLPKSGGLAGLEPYASSIRHAYLIGAATDEFTPFMKTNSIAYTQAGTLENAVKLAHQNAQTDARNHLKNPTVLLSPACASFDQFKSYEHRGQVFTDLVKNLEHQS